MYHLFTNMISLFSRILSSKTYHINDLSQMIMLSIDIVVVIHLSNLLLILSVYQNYSISSNYFSLKLNWCFSPLLINSEMYYSSRPHLYSVKHILLLFIHTHVLTHLLLQTLILYSLINLLVMVCRCYLSCYLFCLSI